MLIQFSSLWQGGSIRLGVGAFIVLFQILGCQVEEKVTTEPAVTTLNANYNRLHSHVLVRHVKIPSEGFLDYAAYAKNVMLVDPQWHAVHPTKKIGLGSLDFAGKLVEIKPLLDFTSLTASEKNRPLAWTPVLEHLLKWNFVKASSLVNAYAGITSEKWGDTTDISQPFQEFGAVYIHTRGNVKEIWVELEFKPWLNSFMDGIPDQDKDGYPEVFARLEPSLFSPDMVDEINGEYSNKRLREAEVLDWANNLASRWYPSYNTDLMELEPGNAWPYENSPLNVKSEMSGLWVANPFFILKGRPFEDSLFNVFEIEGMGQLKTADQQRKEGAVVHRGIDKGLSPRLEAITSRVQAELKLNGKGKWPEWIKRLAPFQNEVRQFSQTEANDVQGLALKTNDLVFRRELEYLLAGDLEHSTSNQHPVASIAEFKDYLAARGIDFLFVPVPTKLDVYPELIAANADSLPGHIAQPYFRKLLLDLAEARVETIDLLEPFLKLKYASEVGKRALYQRQDTHWTTVGLETTAQLLAERIRLYSWYESEFPNKRDYRLRDSVFGNLGDIQARLTDAKKAGVPPEQVLGHQVLEPNGTPYQDSDSSSVLVLGDSYTGVFQSVGCRHAGVTAHLARGLGAPVDLIMGWGGGPEAPDKLRKRGEAYLKSKRLVIWIMSARDVFVYPGEWSIK